VHLSLIPKREYIIEALAGLDGVLLPGSNTDVDPHFYGEEPHPKLGTVIPEKDETDLLVLDEIERSNMPLLAICYGMQALAMKLGGGVEPSDHREYGYATVKLVGCDPLLKDLAKEGAELNVWMSHGDRVETLPPGFAAIASSVNSPLAAMADVKRKIYGLQFHPEVMHTPKGKDILKFLLKRKIPFYLPRFLFLNL
jgi:GMP synthase (glutamine-hydrolysing) A subunit